MDKKEKNGNDTKKNQKNKKTKTIRKRKQYFIYPSKFVIKGNTDTILTSSLIKYSGLHYKTFEYTKVIIKNRKS